MPKNAPILLVEDDEVDVMTVRRAMREVGVDHPLVVAGNGEEALEYLRAPDRARPRIILLDLNMPRMNGIELLAELKQDPEFKRIPAIVLTTSRGDEDRVKSYDECVAGYIVKPVNYEDFVQVVRIINDYWELSEFA